MNMMMGFWIAVCVLLVILEASTAMLVCIWFVGGAAVALIVSLCGGPLWLQLVLFVVVSAALLLLLRPFLKKHTTQNVVRTNVEAEIGKRAVVVETVDNLRGTGRVMVGSVDWTARSLDDTVIEAGTQVEICEIKGVRAYVKPVEVPVSMS